MTFGIRHKKAFRLLVTSCSLLVTITGCGPTYPKEKFKESIVRVCKNEYHVDVKVETIDKTVAIYLPLPNLIDFTFAITKEAGEKINDVILTVSRVALSTDARFEFYVVIAHDTRIPEIQIVIIKSVDDVRRFMLNDISRGEYAKRMLIDMRFSPQAQKERAIKDVFEKMSLDPKWQEQVMNDFFRSEPTGLGDIGYWNDHFYIKDIALPEFIAEQTASRVKMEFREDKALADRFFLKSSKGSFVTQGKKKYFRFELFADDKALGVYLDAKTAAKKSLEEIAAERPDMVFKAVLKVANQVIHGYRFDDYDYIEIINQRNNRMFKVTRDNAELYRKKKLKFEELVMMSE